MNTASNRPRGQAITVAIFSLFTLMCAIVFIRAPQELKVLFLFLFLGCLLSAVKPGISILIGFTLLLAVPAEAQVLVTGIYYGEPSGTINLHILTYYAIGSFFGVLIGGGQDFHRFLNLAFIRRTVMIFGFFILVELVVALTGLGGQRLTNLFPDVYVGPFLYFLTVASYVAQNQPMKILERALWLLFIIGLFAIFEEMLNVNPFYRAFYEGASWWRIVASTFNYQGLYRVTTSLGHPLINASYFLAGALISFYIFIRSETQRQRLRYLVLMSVFTVAMLTTLSRASFLILIMFVTAFLFIDSTRHWSKHGVYYVLLLGVLLVVYFFNSALFAGLASRGTTINESSLQVRASSLDMLLAGRVSISFFGSGAYTAANQRAMFFGHGAGNFENGWLIAIIELGILSFILYASVILNIVGKGIGHLKNVAPVLFSAVGTIVMFGSYNSFGNRTTVNYLLWMQLAFIAGMVARQAYGSKAEGMLG